jgi:hypothetical protein
MTSTIIYFKRVSWKQSICKWNCWFYTYLKSLSLCRKDNVAAVISDKFYNLIYSLWLNVNYCAMRIRHETHIWEYALLCLSEGQLGHRPFVETSLRFLFQLFLTLWIKSFTDLLLCYMTTFGRNQAHIFKYHMRPIIGVCYCLTYSVHLMTCD